MSVFTFIDSAVKLMNKFPNITLTSKIFMLAITIYAIHSWKQVGIIKANPMKNIEKKVDDLWVIVNNLVLTIDTDKNKKLKLQGYNYELSNIANRKLSKIRDSKVKSYLSLKCDEIIELYNAMQSKEKDIKNLEYWINTISGKAEDFYYKAEDMTGKQWCDSFHIGHSWRTQEFKENIEFLYNDEENNKDYRLYKIFEGFIDDTLTQAIAMEYVK